MEQQEIFGGKTNGFEIVAEAVNSEEAAKLAFSWIPDIVVVGISMLKLNSQSRFEDK